MLNNNSPSEGELNISQSNLTVEKIFNNHLNIIEDLFHVKLPGDTVGERIEELITLGNVNVAFAQAVTSHAVSLIDQISIQSAAMKKSDNLFPLVSKMIIACAIKAAVFSYKRHGSLVPKHQHWLPVVYLKNFGERVSGSSRNRSIEINGVYFQDNLNVSFITRDNNFIHPVENGEGFYSPSTERFFSVIEEIYGNYTNLEKKDHRNSSIVVPAAFFVIQSVRNPHPESMQFHYSSLSEVVNAIIKNMNILNGKMFIRQDRSRSTLPFTPYIPPNMVKTVKNDKIFVFPIRSKTALILSTVFIDDDNSKKYIQRYRVSLVKKAKKNNTGLFGVSKASLYPILKRL